jgi:processive 1,2-diacylglycerol beta-glucosyltransferase
MPLKILVLSAAVGVGHLRAAEAVELALRELAPDDLVENHDVLTLTNSMFRKLYGSAYLDLVNKMPHVLGYFYDYLDRPLSTQKKSDSIRRLAQRMNLGKFMKFLRANPWDVVINTHFLPAEMIAGLKLKGEFPAPQLTVTTDFETHRLWANEPCEHYFTATREGACYLEHWGVPGGRVTVTGIPIHPRFAKRPSREECRAKHGIDSDRPVVLQLAGGFGVGPIELILDSLSKIEQPLQLLVVTGRNTELKEKLQSKTLPERHRVKILGFTTEMDELMTAADLIVTKPGGLTTSEALACGAAIVVVNPIPGQESRNSDFLLEHGAAIKVNNMATLQLKVGDVLANPARLQTLRANAAALGKPHAAHEIAVKALQFAREHHAQKKLLTSSQADS